MSSNNDTLNAVRSDIEAEDRTALRRAKIGIGIRAVLTVFIFVYMTWIFSSITKLDAQELTRIAATSVQDQLPMWRSELHDYAVDLAPEATDHARDLFVSLPVKAREYLESELLVKTDQLIAHFEKELDLAISTVIDDQVELVMAEYPDATPEVLVDTIVLGVSAIFHETMIAAIDELYEHYAIEVQALNAHLDRLLRDEDLTESEKIDRELIEAWMVLVHKHNITQGKELVAGLSQDF
jgi:hypothetical protein